MLLRDNAQQGGIQAQAEQQRELQKRAEEQRHALAEAERRREAQQLVDEQRSAQAQAAQQRQLQQAEQQNAPPMRRPADTQPPELIAPPAPVNRTDHTRPVEIGLLSGAALLILGWIVRRRYTRRKLR